MSAVDRKVLELQLLNLAPAIDEYFNPNKDNDGVRRIGFFVAAFEFGHAGDGDSLVFVCNANPDDMAAALRECIEQLAANARLVTAPSQESSS